MRTRDFAAPCLVSLLVASLLAGCSAAAPSGTPFQPQGSEGKSVSEKVMRAWASGNRADIEAVYSPVVSMWVDAQTLAKDRSEMASVISNAIQYGNTYRQVGPVIEYRASDGDLYVTTTVEVVGKDHPSGDPVIGFYRVHDGLVIRHVFLDARLY